MHTKFSVCTTFSCLYCDECTRTLGHSDSCYPTEISCVWMEVGNCPVSVVCCEQCLHVCGLVSHIDAVVSNPPIPVLGKWGVPVEIQ